MEGGGGIVVSKPRKTRKWPNKWSNIDRGYYQDGIYLFKVSKSTMETTGKCVRSIQVTTKAPERVSIAELVNSAWVIASIFTQDLFVHKFK